MKSLLLNTLLLGMVLIHIPRSLLHECEHDIHTCAHPNDHTDDEKKKDLSFYADDCDLCIYAFHALDTPDSDVIRVPDVFCSFESSVEVSSVKLPSAEGILLRGPPNSFSLS